MGIISPVFFLPPLKSSITKAVLKTLLDFGQETPLESTSLSIFKPVTYVSFYEIGSLHLAILDGCKTIFALSLIAPSLTALSLSFIFSMTTSSQ
jgi:hypothetical protein